MHKHYVEVDEKVLTRRPCCQVWRHVRCHVRCHVRYAYDSMTSLGMGRGHVLLTRHGERVCLCLFQDRLERTDGVLHTSMASHSRRW